MNTNSVVPQPVQQITALAPAPIQSLPPASVKLENKSSKLNLMIGALFIMILIIVGFIVYTLIQLNNRPAVLNNYEIAEKEKVVTLPDIVFGNFTKLNNAILPPTNTTSTDGRLPNGLAGSGDSVDASHTTLLKIGLTYKMWYEGLTTDSTPRIYYAESNDMLTWRKKDNSLPQASDTTSTNGRIPLGTEGKGDSKGASNPSVLFLENEYKMWYCGFNGSNRRVFHATSPDGLTWTKKDNSIPDQSNTTGTNGRIPNGLVGTFDERDSCAPELMWDKEDQIYKMWYSSVDPGYIGYATSPDGLTWTKKDNSIPDKSNTTGTNGRIPNGLQGSADARYVRNATVVKVNSKYHMWYVGRPIEQMGQVLVYATSLDGLTWTKFNNDLSIYKNRSNGLGMNGSLLLGTEGTRDFEGFGAADALYEDGVLYLVYFGFNVNNGIETAVSVKL